MYKLRQTSTCLSTNILMCPTKSQYQKWKANRRSTVDAMQCATFSLTSIPAGTFFFFLVLTLTASTSFPLSFSAFLLGAFFPFPDPCWPPPRPRGTRGTAAKSSATERLRRLAAILLSTSTSSSSTAAASSCHHRNRRTSTGGSGPASPPKGQLPPPSARARARAAYSLRRSDKNETVARGERQQQHWRKQCGTVVEAWPGHQRNAVPDGERRAGGRHPRRRAGRGVRWVGGL